MGIEHISDNRFMEFRLGEEDYGVPLLAVKEVISVPETTPIPNSPKYFLGVMNLRGQVITILDLRKKLNIESNLKNENEAVIILDLDGMMIGVQVDAINCVLNVEAEKVDDMSNLSNKQNSKYIYSVFKKKDSLTMLLDIYKVLDIEKPNEGRDFSEAVA